MIMKNIFLPIIYFFILLIFNSCAKDSNNCIGCGNPTIIAAGTIYCEGQVFQDDWNIAPNHDGVVLTNSIMNDIVSNSNGWCTFQDMGSQDGPSAQ